MCDQVGEDVRRSSVEDPVFLVVGNRFNRSFELPLEIFEARHLREFVALLPEEVIGLIDHNVGWEDTAQLFDERRLSGSVSS